MHVHKVAFAVLLCLVAACSRGGDEPLTPEAVSEPQAAVARAPEPSEVRPGAGRALPAIGEVVVEVSDRGVTLLANQAPRLEILRQLESASGVKVLVRKPSDREWANVTLKVVGVPAETAFERVLHGIAYQLHYRVKRADGSHVLGMVAVGRKRGMDETARAERRGGRRQRRTERRPERQPSPEALEREQDQEELAAQVARQLEDADPVERVEGVSSIETDNEGVARLTGIVENDPSVAVRVAAVERLGDADTLAATSQLLLALRDSHPDVVLAAIDALEFVGDESIAPQLEFLLQHEDPRVRVAASEAIDFLE
jgi:hypothetical protein